MTEKERQLFPLVWALVGKQQDLIQSVLPAVHQIRTVLSEGQTPSREQLQAWREKSEAFDELFDDLSAEIESLHAISFEGVATN